MRRSRCRAWVLGEARATSDRAKGCRMSVDRRWLHVKGESRSHVEAVADQLVDLYFDPDAKEMQHIGSYELPSSDMVAHIVDECRALMFPGYAGPDVTGTRPE